MLRLLSRYLGRFVLIITLQALSLGGVSRSGAKDLTEVFAQGFSFSILGGGDAAAGATKFAPAFSAAVAQAVTQEFPLASVSPAFAYRFDSAIGAYARSTLVPGPLFSERALTLGGGKLNFSVGYSFIDFSDLNDTNLDNIRSPALLNNILLDKRVRENTVPPGILALNPGETLFSIPVSGVLIRTRLDVNAHIIVPALRYGITDKWDVGLTVPIVDTFLRVRNEKVLVVDLDSSRARFFAAIDVQGRGRFLGVRDLAGNRLLNEQLPFIRSERTPESLGRAAGSATGVGDISLRTKYHLWQTETGGAALGLNLQLPSGEVRDFHGTDEVHLSTLVYLSQVLWERFEPHLNVGVDFNTDDVDRSSFLYAVGATILVGTKLGLVVDFLGRSEFGQLQVRVPKEGIYQGVILNKATDTCTKDDPCFIRGPKSFPFLPLKIKRNDIADFSFGLRYALGTAGSAFFGGIVPLDGDGLRADFIPSGGIEYTF